METLNPHLFADAAFADELKTSKSTSGAFLTLRSDDEVAPGALRLTSHFPVFPKPECTSGCGST